tara:strand:- start:2117 stop:3136 length:1020 start_codon:yes stop_codon:yes gene_type:complete
MGRLNNCLNKKKYKGMPIWFMRQAGRYLNEFRKIRKENPDFIKLCLTKSLVSKISLQPIKRFDIDGVILFSDILIIPYGLGQNVFFKKNFGPILGNFNLDEIVNTEKNIFIDRVSEVYKSLSLLKKKIDYKNKSLIGFAGSPWTLLLYMIHKQSPKSAFNINTFLKNKNLIDELLVKLEKFICLHIDKQIDSGANVIQIFDSWAGLLPDKDLLKYCYIPNSKIVNHVKKRNIPIICFPKGIKKENYVDFCNFVKPSCISIDDKINPDWFLKRIKNIPIQGGMNPKILLTNKKKVEKEVIKYLDIFKGYPYIFNLGHGVLPKTNPLMIKFVIKTIRDRTC